MCSLPLFYLFFSLQDRYSAIVVRIPSRAGWTIYSLRRCHVLPHPLTPGKPKWTQVRHFSWKNGEKQQLLGFFYPLHLIIGFLSGSLLPPSTSQYLSVEMTKNALTIFLKIFRQINLDYSLDSDDLNYEWFSQNENQVRVKFSLFYTVSLHLSLFRGLADIAQTFCCWMVPFRDK